MRVGINCFSINPNYGGGINTYTFGLLSGFENEGNNHSFQIYVKDSNKHLFGKYKKNNFEIILINETKLKKLLRASAFAAQSKLIYRAASDLIYKNLIETIDKNSDVVYTPTTILYPYGFNKPTIVSMHDIQQFHFPEFFSKMELLNRKIHYSLSVDLVDYIQASSRFIKDDLLKHYPRLKEDQILVINEGVDIPLFSAKKETDYLLKKYDLPDEFLFFPAQLWHHKNHITVLKALNKIDKKYGKKIPLILTGSKASASDQIFSFIQENKMDYVKHLGLVPFDDLLTLYQKGKFLITAVLYESSSLPILEAAASGTPVIASKTPPNVEMSKILELSLFDPENEEQLAELIIKIWDDNGLINSQKHHNNKNISYYSWDNVAKNYLDFFSNILSNNAAIK